jgi:hypothetical protein
MPRYLEGNYFSYTNSDGRGGTASTTVTIYVDP